MAQTVNETLLKYKVDTGSISQAVASVDKVKKALASAGTEAEKAFAKADLDKSLKAAGKAAAKVAAETGDAQEAAAALREELAKTGATEKQVTAVARAFDQETAAIERANQKLDEQAQKMAAVEAASQGRGNVLSTLGREMRALPAVPLPIGFSSDILGKFIDLMGKVGPVVSIANTATAALTPLLGATTAGIVGMVAALAPVAVVVGAVGVAFTAFTRLLEQQASALEAAKNQLAGDTQGRIDNAIAIKTASSESLKAQLEEQKIKLEITRADLAARKEQLDIVRQQYEDLGASFDPAQRAALGQAGQAWEAEIVRLTEDERQLADAIANTTNNILPGVEAREAEQKAIEDTEAALKKREQAEKTIAALYDQAVNAQAQAADQARQIAEDRALRESREQEDFNARREETLKQHIEKIADIEASGQQRLEDIHARGAERIANADKGIADVNRQIADVAAKMRDDLVKVEQRAAGDRAKALEKARRDEQKALVDFNRRKQEIERSFQDAAFDAELSNNVLALIEAERRRDAEHKQNSEQFNDAKQQRQQALADELAEIEARKQERIAEIQAAAEARRQELAQELAERQAARAAIIADIQAQLEAEKARIAETKKAAQDALTEQLAKEDAARKLRLQRQAEDDRIADSRRAAALSKQLADIQTRIQAEQQAANMAVTAWQNAGKLIAAAAPSPGSSSLSSPYRAPSPGGSRQRIAFASGGVATRPTVGLLGERPGYHEALIPFRQSEGIAAALSRLGMTGGQTINISLGQIGGEVSRAEVENNLRLLGETMLNILNDARSGRYAGV